MARRPSEYLLATSIALNDTLSFLPSALTRLNKITLANFKLSFASKNVTWGVGTLTYGASVALDFSAEAIQTLSLTGDVELTTSNRSAGRRLEVRLVADGTPRTLTIPAWKWVGGAAPASLAAGKTGVLQLRCFGANDTDIVASYLVES